MENEKQYPSVETILRDWLTTKQVADMHDMTDANVRYLCINNWSKSKDAMRIGREWYIRPETAAAYDKVEQRTGRPKKED